MTRDPDLDQRIADVLAKLATLSEVPAASLDITQAKDAEHDLPGGVSARATNPDTPPTKDRSLFDYWSWYFARAENDSLRWFYVYMAESDYSQRVHRIPEQRTAARPQAEDRNHMMLTLYEGWPSNQAAVAESLRAGYCPEANLRKVRSMDRRDPNDGRKLAGWAGWSDEQRVKAINSWKAKGVTSPTAIAAELGTRRQSVERYIGGYRRRPQVA